MKLTANSYCSFAGLFGNKDFLGCFSVTTSPAVSTDCVCCTSPRFVKSVSDILPRSCGKSVPGSRFFSFETDFGETPELSKSVNLIWLSVCIFVILFDNLSILKLISSYLLVNS